MEAYYRVIYNANFIFVVFCAKTANGIYKGRSDWQTFIQAGGARSAVKKSEESLEELAHREIWISVNMSGRYHAIKCTSEDPLDAATCSR